MTISVKDLSHRFGAIQALSDLNVQTSGASVVAVIGPNAAGKSTLLRCVIGAVQPDAGWVQVDGLIAHKASPRRLASRLAYVPQRPLVSAGFSVREVVELGRYALPPDSRRVEDAMATLDVIDLASRPFPGLSVGQQQRVALARALAQVDDGGHLILDEPTSAMDLEHEFDVLQMIRRLSDRRITALMAIHDLSLAARYADEVWLLREGRLVASGPTSAVMTIERLREVFGVDFQWIGRNGQERILHASPSPARSDD